MKLLHASIALSVMSVLLLASDPAAAGSFDGKPKLLLHARATTTKSPCSPANTVTDCASAVTSSDLYPVIRHVYVLAHRGGGMLDMAGIQFGITYEGGNVSGMANGVGVDIYGWTLCDGSSEVEYKTAGWPAPGSGNTIAWATSTACQTAEVTVFGYFYTAAYSADILALTAHPAECQAKLADCLSREWPLDDTDLGSVAFSAGATVPGCNPCDGNCGSPLAPPVLSATGQCAAVQLNWVGSSPTGQYLVYQDGQPNPALPVAGTSYLVSPVDGLNHCYEVADFICPTNIGPQSVPVCLATVTAIPSISMQPAATAQPEGGSAMFTVTATGVDMYQWRKVGGGNVGTNSPSLTLGPPLVPGDAGDYVVDLTNICGVRTSAPATLTVCEPIVVSVPPVDTAQPEGGTAVFTVTATGVTSYQWRKVGGGNIGTNSPTLTIGPPLSQADAGDYVVDLTTLCELQTTDPVTLTVCEPIVVSLPPVDTEQPEGGSATFSITATGATNYQWRKVGGGNVGTDSPILTLGPPLTQGDAGDYVVDLTNLCNELETSGPATLTVCEPMVVTLQPLTYIEPLGTDLTFDVMVTGTGPISYQWYLDGQPLSDNLPHLVGTNGPSLSLDNITSTDEGFYSCRMTDTCLETIDSGFGQLTIDICDPPPTISLAPMSQTVPIGNTALITATFNDQGCSGLSFDWRFNNVSLGAPSSPMLTLSNVQPSQSGPYTCQITAGGASTVSNISILNTAAPIFTSCVSTAVTCSSVTVQWCTNTPTTAKLEYGPNPGLGTIVNFPSAVCGSAVLPKSGASTKVYYKITATDAALHSAVCGIKMVAFAPTKPLLTLIPTVNPFYTLIPPGSNQALGVTFLVKNNGCVTVNGLIQMKTPLTLGNAPPLTVSGATYNLPKTLTSPILVGGQVNVTPSVYFRRSQMQGSTASGTIKPLKARLTYNGAAGGGFLTINVVLP